MNYPEISILCSGGVREPFGSYDEPHFKKVYVASCDGPYRISTVCVLIIKHPFCIWKPHLSFTENTHLSNTAAGPNRWFTRNWFFFTGQRWNVGALEYGYLHLLPWNMTKQNASTNLIPIICHLLFSCFKGILLCISLLTEEWDIFNKYHYFMP